MSVTWQTLSDAYMNGCITQGEIRWRIFTVLTDENVAEFMASAPEEVKEHVMDWYKSAPQNDEGWSRMIIFGMGWRKEDSPKATAESRRGVEVMRRYLEKVAA